MKKKVILGFLISISIISFALFFFEDHITGFLVNLANDREVIESISADTLQQNNEREVPNHNEDITPLSLTSTVRTVVSSPELAEYMIGQIIIPSRNTNIGILRGVTEDNLMLGAATMKLDQTMGEGNYALAGHYQFEEGVLFNAVYDIAVGTDVYITDKRMVYHYRIYDRDIYPEDALYMIEDGEAQKRGNPILTLMTCPISSKNKTRVFARGDLIDSYPFEVGMFNE